MPAMSSFPSAAMSFGKKPLPDMVLLHKVKAVRKVTQRLPTVGSRWPSDPPDLVIYLQVRLLAAKDTLDRVLF